jgi:hypothetical protein
MHDIKTVFDKLYPIIQQLLSHDINAEGNFLQCGAKPKFSDLAVITLSLVSESLSIDSENLLFMKLTTEYRNDFPTLIHRTQYNVRRRNLFAKIDEVRKRMAKALLPHEDTFLVDSMPLEACKLSRAHRSSICKETFDTAPDTGFCASQQSYFYGYKLHGLCSLNGVFTFPKPRKRIETLFAQLCDQFMIRRNYAKTFRGFKTRILAKLTALTVAQFFNKFVNNKPLNHIKYAIT